MAIPLELPAWSALGTAAKRARILAVADEQFSREGTDLSMPTLAAAVGAGVASVYRVFASKDELLAALLVERLAAVRARFAAADREPEVWPALREAVLATVDDGLRDRVARDAWDMTVSSAHPLVLAAREEVGAAIDALVARAVEQGAVEPGITGGHVRLVFHAARHVDQLGDCGARALAELVLRGMATPSPRDR
jgi:AcrR family transcriptional regulator